MKNRSKTNQSIVDVAKRMPPLYHKHPDMEFDIRRARTLWWLVKQPEVLNHIWNIVKQSGAIKYVSAAGKWQGVDFKGEEKI